MILVDGKPADMIPADDRGLAYGDGLFETLRARHGQLPLLDYHLQRLEAGLHALGFPSVARDVLVHELQVAAADVRDGIVKLIVTRGSAGRGYAPPRDAAVRRIVQTAPLPPHVDEWRKSGVNVRFCTTPLAGPSALDGLKHLNRLPQVLARAEWNDPDIHEGLMRDMQGRVIEGTMSNIFIVRDAILLTPSIAAGVRGVMRRFVLERAEALGVSTRECFVTDEEISSADEVFITNSVIGVCPVVRAGSQPYRIGTITRQLQSAVDTELEHRACSAN